MKNRIVLFIAMFVLFSINDAFAQQEKDEIREIVVIDAIPVKSILVVNGVLIRDSLTSIKLKRELVSFKTKTKRKRVSESVAEKLGINYNPRKLGYSFDIVEIKDVIIDPETMELIKIK